MFSVRPQVRVSVRHDIDGNSTLRCYAEGYYPDYNMDMVWYYDDDPDTWFRSSCQHAPNSDGTYRLTCDYICNRSDIYRVTCRVRQGFTNIDTRLHPERKATKSIVDLYIIVIVATLCAFMIALFYVYENDIVTLVKAIIHVVLGYKRMTYKEDV